MRIRRITPAGRADVYNLEVERVHDFAVESGVIIHNCADETRYFAMTRPITAKDGGLNTNSWSREMRRKYAETPTALRPGLLDMWRSEGTIG